MQVLKHGCSESQKEPRFLPFKRAALTEKTEKQFDSVLRALFFLTRLAIHNEHQIEVFLWIKKFLDKNGANRQCTDHNQVNVEQCPKTTQETTK